MQIFPDRKYRTRMRYSTGREELTQPYSGQKLLDMAKSYVEPTHEAMEKWLTKNCPLPKAICTLDLLPESPYNAAGHPPAIDGMGQYYESCEDGRMLFERHIWLVDRWVRQWRSCPVELYVFLLNTTQLKMAEEELSLLYPWINLV